MQKHIYTFIFMMVICSCSSRREELLKSMQKVSEKVSARENYKIKSSWRKMSTEVADNGNKPSDVKYLENAQAHLKFFKSLNTTDSLDESLLKQIQERIHKIEDSYIREECIKLASQYSASYKDLYNSGLCDSQKAAISKMMVQYIQAAVLNQYVMNVGSSCCFCFDRIVPQAILPAKKFTDGEKITARIMLTLDKYRQRIFIIDNTDNTFSKQVYSMTQVAPTKTGIDTVTIPVEYENAFGELQSDTLKYSYKVEKCN